jgi:hypothetical protein
MAVIPDKYVDLLGTKKAFANLATVLKDGHADGLNRGRSAKEPMWRWRSWTRRTPTDTCRFAER